MSEEDGTMDPNTALAEIRAIVTRSRSGDLAGADARRLVELVKSLDGWLADGGFPPNAWIRPGPTPQAGAFRQPWWQVRPSELAWRYGCDADQLRDDVNPEDLSEWQFDLIMAAIAIADKRMTRMRIPEA